VNSIRVSPLHHVPLGRIDRSQIKRLLADLLKSRAPKTVELTYAVISGIFSEANDLGYTDQNPAHGLLRKVLPPKSKRALKEPDPFSRQDLEKFLQAAWRKLPHSLALVLEVMAMTGMRLGEALAMRLGNLDVANGHYLIAETRRRGYGPPKSGKRLIDLEEDLVMKLESHIRRLGQESLVVGTKVDYFFPGLTQRMVQSAMQRACLAAKLRARRPHDLRHTYATLLLMDHYSPAYVQKQLGHHSISMTVDTYGHWIPGEGKKDLKKTLRGDKSKPPARLLHVVK
jgi:integrase